MDRLSYEDISKIVKYDPSTGKLFWLERPMNQFVRPVLADTWNRRFAGREALSCANSNGYKHGTIGKKTYFAHRVVWLLCTGSWPENVIDHIDMDRSNNRMENLRDVSKRVNAMNTGLYKNNTSGVVGVGRTKNGKKWRARIVVNRIESVLGEFNTIEEATSARNAALSVL